MADDGLKKQPAYNNEILMISNQDPQDIINPKPKVTPLNCISTHGMSGFMQGTKYDKALGRFVCPCGRQYTSNIEKPDWIVETNENQNQPVQILPSL